MINAIVKRDGRTAIYDVDKIASAIFKAANSLGGTNRETSLELAGKVEEYLADTLGEETPSVETVQDARLKRCS